MYRCVVLNDETAGRSRGSDKFMAQLERKTRRRLRPENAGLAAVPLGYLADHTSITFVFQLCAVLPAIGLLTVFLPDSEQLKAR